MNLPPIAELGISTANYLLLYAVAKKDYSEPITGEISMFAWELAKLCENDSDLLSEVKEIVKRELECNHFDTADELSYKLTMFYIENEYLETDYEQCWGKVTDFYIECYNEIEKETGIER